MFCPNCKVEYRPGFTKCSDCGADLVEHLSKGDWDQVGKVLTDSEGRELLWSGVHPTRLPAALGEALDAAHIQYKQTTKEFGLTPGTAQAALFVWVDRRDRGEAGEILDKILAHPDLADQAGDNSSTDAAAVNPLGLNRKGLELAELQDGTESENELPDYPDDEPVPEDFAEDPDPEDATAEVWAGEDAEMAQNLAVCLRGVGVGCVVSEESGKSRVRVVPGAEKRAGEIVREVVDASPPQ
jgi:hypothetical protein